MRSDLARVRMMAVDDIAATRDLRQMRHILRSLAAAAGAALAACAAPPRLPPQVAACQIRPGANLALRQVRDFLLLPATIDGQPVQMALDTGAEVSTISPGVAARLGLPQDQTHGRVLMGVGGAIRTGSVVIPSFVLGDSPPQAVRLSLGAAEMLPGAEPPVAGLLGADLLAGRDLDLDVPSGRATLYTISSCPSFTPWEGAIGVPLASAGAGLQFVIADVDGHPVRALLDTGARNTLMTRRFARSLGVTDAMLAVDAGSAAVGVSRLQIVVRRHRVGHIAVGPVAWPDVTVGVADVRLPGADLLLGADLLGRQRIWISTYRRLLWLR